MENKGYGGGSQNCFRPEDGFLRDSAAPPNTQNSWTLGTCGGVRPSQSGYNSAPAILSGIGYTRSWAWDLQRVATRSPKVTHSVSYSSPVRTHRSKFRLNEFTLTNNPWDGRVWVTTDCHKKIKFNFAEQQVPEEPITCLACIARRDRR